MFGNKNGCIISFFIQSQYHSNEHWVWAGEGRGRTKAIYSSIGGQCKWFDTGKGVRDYWIKEVQLVFIQDRMSGVKRLDWYIVSSIFS